MLAGAAGVLAASMADTLLAPILVPDVPRYLTGMASYVAYLFPAPLPLLVGAVLAFLAHRRSQALI